ncbi:MAG: hypothetical protein ACI9S8_002007 [Chlamydiales bacterium]|jgi:hypothetical protein
MFEHLGALQDIFNVVSDIITDKGLEREGLF